MRTMDFSRIYAFFHARPKTVFLLVAAVVAGLVKACA